MRLIALAGRSGSVPTLGCGDAPRKMKLLEQLKAATVSDDVPPDIRWVMFWLFWAFYALSGREVVLGLREPSEALALPVTTFAALSFLAGGLLTAAWSARFERVGLLAWVERLPRRMLQSAQLTGLVLLLVALFSGTPWGTGIEQVHEPALMLGFCLTALTVFCNKVGPPFGRRRA